MCITFVQVTIIFKLDNCTSLIVISASSFDSWQSYFSWQQQKWSYCHGSHIVLLLWGCFPPTHSKSQNTHDNFQNTDLLLHFPCTPLSIPLTWFCTIFLLTVLQPHWLPYCHQTLSPFLRTSIGIFFHWITFWLTFMSLGPSLKSYSFNEIYFSQPTTKFNHVDKFLFHFPIYSFLHHVSKFNRLYMMLFIFLIVSSLH